MLLELHVKNLALIEKADVEFGEGLNILTGETGAGKSIIIGSVTMALGGKASKDVIRRGADHAYIELIFFVDSKEKKKALMQLGTEPTEEGMVIISRKIMPSRSVSRINDETVTMARLRQITGLLLDIHGQHEHQSLLYKSKHLEILDAYVKAQTQPVKRKIEEEYKNYCKLKERLLSFKTDEDARLREMDFLRFEIQEIENGEVKEGEEEELTLKYRRFAHARRIAEELENARGLLQRDFAAQALRSVEQAAEYDKALEGIRDQLYDAEAILNDASREISSYMGSMEFDEEVFRTTESRLDQIHDLQRKYGNTTQLTLENLEKKKNRLEELDNFDRLPHFTASGYDEAQFLISTNPGQPVRPLMEVASGGELSRIMLAIKTVLADSDDIPTLIFDEIDTGISGRTAQKVSEKLSYIAKSHQVICITHLPQIAAMADTHFEIHKAASEGSTATSIRRLNREQTVEELARLLGGAKITDTVIQNAREMKELADKTK